MAEKSQNSLGQTYDTLQGTVVQGDVEGLQNAVNQGGPGGSNLLLVGLVVIVILAGIIETGTFFGIILPSDIILSASVLALVSLGKRWMVALITVLSIVFTVVGDQLGYYTGFKLGSGLYDRKDTWYFKKKYLLQAQEALQTGGEKFLYVGRYVGFGGILPTIYGMMKWDRAKFFKVSVLSAIMWKLSIIVPLVLLILIFPSLKSRFALLLLLAAAVPEIIGWIMLLKPQAEKYFERLSHAKESIQAIRNDLKSIGSHMREVGEKLKTPSEGAGASIGEVPVAVLEEATIQEKIMPETIPHDIPVSDDTTLTTNHTNNLTSSTIPVQEVAPSHLPSDTSHTIAITEELTPDTSIVTESYFSKFKKVGTTMGKNIRKASQKVGEIGGKIGTSVSQVVVSAQDKIEELKSDKQQEQVPPTSVSTPGTTLQTGTPPDNPLSSSLPGDSPASHSLIQTPTVQQHEEVTSLPQPGIAPSPHTEQKPSDPTPE